MIKINPFIIKMFNRLTDEETEIGWFKNSNKASEMLTIMVKDNLNPNLSFSLDVTKPDRFIEENSLEEAVYFND